MARRWPIVYKATLTKNTGDTLKFTSGIFSGTIRKILIDIPIGVAYTAGIRFEFEGAKQSRFPVKETDSEDYFIGDDDHIPLQPDLEINEGTIKIFGANSSTVNDHKIVVTIEIEKIEAVT